MERPDEERSTEPSGFRATAVYRWGKEIVLFGAILIGVFWFQTRSLVGTGEAAPTFDLPTLNGSNVSRESLAGKPTVLFFWAPWCGVCEADAHNMGALHEAKGDSVNVIPVAMSFEDLSSVRDFAERNALPEPIVLGDRLMAESYRVDAFPTIYVLDEEGKIAGHAVGYTTELGLRARLLWASF